jgi:hypothetical protein
MIFCCMLVLDRSPGVSKGISGGTVSFFIEQDGARFSLESQMKVAATAADVRAVTATSGRKVWQCKSRTSLNPDHDCAA